MGNATGSAGIGRAAVAALLSLLVSACGGGGGGGGGGKVPFGDVPRPTSGSFIPDGQGQGCPDAFEPNDNPAAARPLGLGGAVALDFCDDASDYFVVNGLTPGATYQASTSSLQLSADTVLDVIDPSTQAVIASNDDSNGSLASQVSFPAPGTSVLILARQFDSTQIGQDTGYVLTLLDVASGTPAELSIGLAQVASFISNNQFEFSAEVINNGGTGAVTNLAFYISSDRDITTADRFFAEALTPSVEPGQVQTVTGTLTLPDDLAGTEFFLGIIVDDLNQIAESDESNNSTFIIAPFFAAGGGEICADDAAENDDSRETATFAFPGDSFFSTHCADSADWFEFPATANVIYDLSTTFLYRNADTIIQVFDQQGTLIAENDDFLGPQNDLFLGFLSRVSVSVPTDQNVAVKVSRFGEGFGFLRQYTFHVRERDALPDLLSHVESIPETAQAGTPISLGVRVVNVGAGNAPPTTLGATLYGYPQSTLTAFDAYDLGRVDVPALPAGASTIVTLNTTIPEGLSGSFSIEAYADVDELVAETVDTAFYNSTQERVIQILGPVAKAGGTPGQRSIRNKPKGGAPIIPFRHR